MEALQRNGHNLGLLTCDTAGKYDIPILKPVNDLERMIWLSFNCVPTDTKRFLHGVHFFIDDYLFQRVWNDPTRYAGLLQDYLAVMSPDFSLFTDYPKAVQIYNHWRKHCIAAYWQSLGMTVIPSICWADHDSYEWCFDGEPVGGIVAVSSVGTQKNPVSRQLFLDGYNEMLARLKPTKILFFGDIPKGCDGNIEHHEPYYKTVLSRRKSLASSSQQR